jgi:hypothetical protein
MFSNNNCNESKHMSIKFQCNNCEYTTSMNIKECIVCKTKIMNCCLCNMNKRCEMFYRVKRGRKQKIYSCVICWESRRNTFNRQEWISECYNINNKHMMENDLTVEEF